MITTTPDTNTRDIRVIFQLIRSIITRETIMVSRVENISPNTSSINIRIWLVSRATRFISSPGLRLLTKDSESTCIL